MAGLIDRSGTIERMNDALILDLERTAVLTLDELEAKLSAREPRAAIAASRHG